MGSFELHILCAEEVKAYTRPMSVHIDSHDLDVYINECEQLHIIPAIGYEVFKTIVEERTLPEEAISLDVIVNGGEWVEEKGCGKKVLNYCQGLKAALSYFVYARCLKADGSMVARTGLVRHNDSYASQVDRREKISQYNEVMDVAECYLSSCMRYLNYAKKDKVKDVRSTRCRIKAIGV